MNKIIILFFLVLGIIIIIFSSQNYYSLDDEIFNGLEHLELKKNNLNSFPDIYYIILDEYAGEYSLMKDLDFENTKFLYELENRGFIIPKKSFSNYPYTALSLPSMLNMQYVNFLTDSMGKESNDLKPLKFLREKNLVMSNFKSMNYHIVSFYSGADNVPTDVDEKLCKSETRHKEILCTFSELSKINKRISEPIFAYSHMSLPHDPYIFDREGNSISFDSKNLNEERNQYLEQLEFTNYKVIELIDLIIKEKSRDSIIILQSDHGQRIGVDWNKPTDDMIIQSLNNFNAYYLPDVKKEIIYDGITPVNTFRIIFNEYFNQNFEILEDKNYWVESDQYPYDFVDVTNIIKK